MKLLKTSDQLLYVPFCINQATTIITFDNLLILIGLILCTEYAPWMLDKFIVSFSGIIWAFHHDQAVIRIALQSKYCAFALQI